jgi:hypothetical protein
MRNAFTRGSAPDRARPSDSRPGSFKPGHEKQGGRKRGTPNLFSIDYKRAILEAAYRIGQDGNGKNGITGYFSWVAKCHPRACVSLLMKLLLLEHADSEASEELRWTIEEIDQSVREYIGLTGQHRTKGQWGWTGQDLPVGSLMQLAVENPKAFCTLVAAAFLRPPTKRRQPAVRHRA